MERSLGFSIKVVMNIVQFSPFPLSIIISFASVLLHLKKKLKIFIKKILYVLE